MTQQTIPVRPLGTSEIPGLIQDEIIRIKVGQNAPEFLEAMRSYRRGEECWVGFDENGRIIVMQKCKGAPAELDAATRSRVAKYPGCVAICFFEISGDTLRFSRSPSAFLSGRVQTGDPTLGLDGHVGYGNGEKVRYLRGRRVNSNHEAMQARAEPRVPFDDPAD